MKSVYVLRIRFESDETMIHEYSTLSTSFESDETIIHGDSTP